MSNVEWIKITTDMFDHQKIKYIRKLPEGNNIVLIWIMLLTMAGRCNASGMIFLTENIPYTPKILSDELGFEETTVQLALKVFEELNMIVYNEDYFFISGWEEYQNVEGLEKIREQTRKRVAKHREKQKSLPCNATVTLRNATDKEEEIDIDNNIVSPEDDTSEPEPEKDEKGFTLEDRFNFIREMYPKVRRGSKAKALKTYKQYITSGHKYCDKNIKLTEKQIYEAVKEYIRQQEEQKTEPIYYKNFETLMNQVSDYVV